MDMTGQRKIPNFSKVMEVQYVTFSELEPDSLIIANQIRSLIAQDWQSITSEKLQFETRSKILDMCQFSIDVASSNIISNILLTEVREPMEKLKLAVRLEDVHSNMRHCILKSIRDTLGHQDHTEVCASFDDFCLDLATTITNNVRLNLAMLMRLPAVYWHRTYDFPKIQIYDKKVEVAAKVLRCMKLRTCKCPKQTTGQSSTAAATKQESSSPSQDEEKEEFLPTTYYLEDLEMMPTSVESDDKDEQKLEDRDTEIQETEEQIEDLIGDTGHSASGDGLTSASADFSAAASSQPSAESESLTNTTVRELIRPLLTNVMKDVLSGTRVDRRAVSKIIQRHTDRITSQISSQSLIQKSKKKLCRAVLAELRRDFSAPRLLEVVMDAENPAFQNVVIKVLKTHSGGKRENPFCRFFSAIKRPFIQS